MTYEDVKADTKETMREVENKAKETWRKADGDESVSDKVANAGDDVRDALGNAGDELAAPRATLTTRPTIGPPDPAPHPVTPPPVTTGGGVFLSAASDPSGPRPAVARTTRRTRRRHPSRPRQLVRTGRSGDRAWPGTADRLPSRPRPASGTTDRPGPQFRLEGGIAEPAHVLPRPSGPDHQVEEQGEREQEWRGDDHETGRGIRREHIRGPPPHVDEGPEGGR